jgi:hypothetical protein
MLPLKMINTRLVVKPILIQIDILQVLFCLIDKVKQIRVSVEDLKFS